MKTTKNFFMGVLLLLFSSLSVTAQTNQIQNGGFENWTGGLPDNWTCASSNTTYSATTTAKAGTSALQIVTTSTTSRNFSQALPTDFTAGETYTVSFWYMCTSFPSTSPTLNIKIQWDGTEETVFAPNQTINLTVLNTWTQVTLSGVVPVGATSANLMFSITKKPTIIFDEIVVTKEAADEPALAVAPETLNYTAAGGYMPIQITANRAWTAAVTSTNTSWLYLATGTSGSGNGSITPWTSENNTGAARTGEVTVTLDGGALSKTIAVTQAAKASQAITSLSDISKTVGDADFDLSATATSGLAVTYISSNTSVATISGSTVHIVGAGTTTITASQAGNSSYAAATPVTATLTVEELKVSAIRLGLSIMQGNTAKLTAAVSPTNATNTNVTLSSNNATVATVDNTGNIAALTVGTAIITVASADGAASVEFEINVTISTANNAPAAESNFALHLQPNPVVNEARFTFASAGSGANIIISDVNGKTVAVKTIATSSTSETVDVSSLSKGTYIARYTDAVGKQATVKMIK